MWWDARYGRLVGVALWCRGWASLGGRGGGGRGERISLAIDGRGGVGLVGLASPLLGAIGVETALAVRDAAICEERKARRQGPGEHRRRRIDVVCLATIPRDAVDAYLDLGWIAKVGLVEVLWADVERGELGQRGRRTQAALLDIFDLVVGDEVLRDAAYGEGEGLAGRREKIGEGGRRGPTFFMRPSVLNL